MRKTQEQVIGEALRRGEKLTQRLALYNYHVARLAAVIGKLEAKGWKILHESITVDTLYGRAAITQYSIINE